jgi:hypothetical protein
MAGHDRSDDFIMHDFLVTVRFQDRGVGTYRKPPAVELPILEYDRLFRVF